MVGSKLIFEQGKKDEADGSGWFTKARSGELDIVCVAVSNERVDWLLPPFLTSLTYAVMARLSLTFNDTFKLVSPVATSVRVPNEAGVRSPPFGTEIRSKRTVTTQAIHDSLGQMVQRYGERRVWERGAILSIAVRRFMLAEVRTDAIDQYLDYWLICEVLTGGIPGTPPCQDRNESRAALGQRVVGGEAIR